MTPAVVADSKKAATEPLIVYAGRFARKCLLEQMCPEGHPVLEVEHQLIAEARANLHAHLLRHGKWNRADTERKIRWYAAEKAALLIEDPSIRRLVTIAIQSKPLDDAFPSVN